MIFQQNTKAHLFCLFTNQNGSAATISGTPTISIFHISGGSVKTDVNEANMTQLSGSSYYYEYHAPANADKSMYFARYTATYSDSTVVRASDVFFVVPLHYYDRAGGGLVQRTIVREGWTQPEKDEFFAALSRLSVAMENLQSVRESILSEKSKENSSYKSLESNILDISTFMGNLANSMDKSLKIIYNKIPSLENDSSIKEILSENRNLREKLIELEQNIHKVHSEITENKELYNTRLEQLDSEIIDVATALSKIIPVNELMEVVENDKD